MADEKKKPHISKLLGIAVLIIGSLVAVISPIIFTQPWTRFSFGNTGQIGDTVGGLTAPAIGIMAAILVYLALLSQVDANVLVQEQLDGQRKDDLQQKAFDSLFALFRQVMADLDAVAIVRDESTGPFTGRMTGEIQPQFVTYSGARGIRKVLDRTVREHCERIHDERDEPFTYEKEVIWIQDAIGVFQILLHRLKTAELSPLDRETLISLVNHLFQSRISNLLPGKCPNCKEEHALFPEEFCAAVEGLRTSIEELDSTPHETS